MGQPRVVLSNLLRGLVGTGVTADTGYQNSWLTDDVVSRVWRSSAAGTTFSVKWDRGATGLPKLDTWAVFAAGGATSGASILGNLLVEGGPDGSTWGPVGSAMPTPTGDYLLISPPVGDRWFQFTITLKASEKLVVGLCQGGAQILLPYFSAIQADPPDRGEVVNDTDGGATFTARLRSKRELRQFGWPILGSVARALMASVEDTLGGQFAPFLLQPNSDDPTVFFHGRLTASSGWSQDPSFFFDGQQLSFKESGRSL